MTDVKRPDWLTELIEIVRRLCPPAGRNAPVSAGKPENFGRVSADAERSGWFWIGLTGRPVPGDQLEGACLAPAEGPEQQKFQLIESVQDGNVLEIRVAEHAPANGLFLWLPAREPGLLEKSLLDGLSRINRFELVNRFALGRAHPVPADPSAEAAVRGALNDDQARAWTACRSPGVHLVWGPPGTGKTRVIAQALQDMIASGKSVLLVSQTNIAVDNALFRAAEAIRPQQGVMVRAGIPHLPKIADNPAVCLELLVRAQQEKLELRRHQLEEQIAARQQASDLARLVEVRAELGDFDPSAYQAAKGRVDNAKVLAEMGAELQRLQQQYSEIVATAEIARQRLSEVHGAHRDAEQARQHIAAASKLECELSEHVLGLDMARADVLRLEGIRDRRTAELADAQRRHRFGHKHQRMLIKDNARQLAAATLRRDELAELLPGMSAGLAEQIEGHRRDALPHTAETLARLDDDLQAAMGDAMRASETRDALAVHIQELATEIDHSRRFPEPTAADYELTTRALDQDLPAKLAELPELEHKAKAVERDVAELQKQHEHVVATMRREAAAVRAEILRGAKVVAATLALLRLKPELYERDYDHVIVDEVSAACPPEVLYAASRARSGVTLIGDFLQNGPIAPEKFGQDDAEPAICRWYQQDCFALFGIRDPASAQADPGCVTLAEQHRFGPVITELANAVAYGGMLRAARDERHGTGTEIVIIDVDGLGTELATARPGPKRGQWWPVGALLAHALAERHSNQDGDARGTNTGIVVPYKIQQDLVQDVLNESGASAQIEVGTSHRFQGREFDTVIFDLLEDGAKSGWVSRGNLEGTPWEVKGLRLFNVGITRARRRLYLITNGAAVRKARRGPLRALARLLDTGQVHVIRATDILGLREAPADDPVAAELWEALRSHATLIDLYDEDHLPDELCRRIDEARKRIWLWSPWVGRRSEELLPHLRNARDRDVLVHLVVLPVHEVNRHLKPRHRELPAQFTRTVYLNKEHQKIIVIDRNLTFIGSMNVLAHVPGGRHEVMALFRSSMLVEQILEHERADELSDPPRCQRCGATVRYVGPNRDSGQGGLQWKCMDVTDGPRCGWTRDFADRLGTRNQPRPSARFRRKS